MIRGALYLLWQSFALPSAPVMIQYHNCDATIAFTVTCRCIVKPAAARMSAGD
jgi:hypothetical protein